jgi:hypothetical protein
VEQTKMSTGKVELIDILKEVKQCINQSLNLLKQSN